MVLWGGSEGFALLPPLLLIPPSSLIHCVPSLFADETNGIDETLRNVAIRLVSVPVMSWTHSLK